jgi:hypothetical protein
VQDFAEGTETVEYRPLDSFDDVDPEACRLIKVDIEGGEINFLRGAERFIQTGRPFIYGEFNSFWLDLYDQSFEEVLLMCRSWRYEIYQVKKNGIRQVRSPGEGTENALLVPRESKVDLKHLIK